MVGQAILALMAVLCLGMITGAIITAGIAKLVISHSPPPLSPQIGAPSDALAALDAKFKAALPQLEQLAVLLKSATSTGSK